MRSAAIAPLQQGAGRRTRGPPVRTAPAAAVSSSARGRAALYALLCTTCTSRPACRPAIEERAQRADRERRVPVVRDEHVRPPSCARSRRPRERREARPSSAKPYKPGRSKKAGSRAAAAQPRRERAEPAADLAERAGQRHPAPSANGGDGARRARCGTRAERRHPWPRAARRARARPCVASPPWASGASSA
jgi:hypothetical protein